MIAQIRAELLKLRTTRTTIALILAMIALILLFTLLDGLLTHPGGLASRQDQRQLLSVSSFTAVFAALAGVLLVTSEYRYGTIRPTTLFNPARSHVLTAKAVAGAALWGAIGAGLGAIIHNQIGAVITLLAWGLVVDDLLFGLAPSVGRFTPTRASDALMGLRVDHLLSPGAGAITLIAWAGALMVAGITLSARQDIN
jgi:hypothetical protein